MPTLEEIRRWLRGESVEHEALPSLRRLADDPAERARAEAEAAAEQERLAEAARRKAAIKGKYTISTDGRDAMIRFGKYAGNNLSDLMKTTDGISYLQWVIKQDFPDDLIEVAKYLLGVTT